MPLADGNMARERNLSFLLPIFLACAALLAAYAFLPKIGAADSNGAPGGEISLSISGGPLVGGNSAAFRAVSTCGDFTVYLDGKMLLEGGPVLASPFALEEGGHTLFASGGGCNATLPFSVAPRECEGNATSACVMGGCAGTKACAGGVFSGCILPKKICIPGEKIGCSTNGCAFGYATCNQCGTRFGACLPGTNAADAPCNGSACN